MRCLLGCLLVSVSSALALGQASNVPDEPAGKIALALNTGGHTTPIKSFAFTSDGRKLIVAEVQEVHVWDLASGERERTWRLPNELRKVFVSPDGKTVAVTYWGASARTSVWLLDVPSGNSRLIHPPIFGQEQLVFSPDNQRLAWASEGKSAGIWSFKTKGSTHIIHRSGPVARVSFSQDGNRLLVTDSQNKGEDQAQVWDVTPPGKGKGPITPKKSLFSLEQSHHRHAVWSPDGACFAGWRKKGQGVEVQFWSDDGKKEKAVPIDNFPDPHLLQFGGPDQVILVGTEKKQVKVCLVDRQTGQVQHKPSWSFQTPTFAVSRDGRLLAVTSGPGYRVRVHDLAADKLVRQLGQPDLIPRVVAFSPDSRSIAWGLWPTRPKASPVDLAQGLNLATLEALPPGSFKGFRLWRYVPPGLQEKYEKTDKRKDGKEVLILTYKGRRVETQVTGCRTFAYYLTAQGQLGAFFGKGQGGILHVNGETGKTLSDFGTRNDLVDYMAVSPDGRFLLVARGNQALDLYRVEDTPVLLLHILASGPEWVVWTPQGYYAATPGGEKLIGWAVTTDPNQASTFHPAQRFRARLYRPDVIRKVLETGSVEEAVRAAGAETQDVQKILPPRASLTYKQTGATLEVQARAQAGSRGQPVSELHLLVDGRPARLEKNRIAIESFAPPQEREARVTWTVKLEPGTHKLSLRALAKGTYSISEEALVEVRPPPGLPRPARQGTLYYVGIGVNQFQHHPELTLQGAVADVQSLEKCIKTACAARFKVQPTLLTESQATRKAILTILKDLQDQLKPADAVIVHFCSHGEVDQDRGLYLLCHDTQRNNLKGTALEGQELREVLGKYACPVLLLLDACHAGKFPVMRPLTDPLSRLLADDSCGVAVMTAALAHQQAEENKKGGRFTQALVEGLAKEAKPDEFTKQLFVHNLFTYVFGAVAKQTDNRQMPHYLPSGSVPPIVLK